MEETRVHLDIHFQGKFSEDEIIKKLENLLKETPFQSYKTENQKV